jgi:hypothetical protein
MHVAEQKSRNTFLVNWKKFHADPRQFLDAGKTLAICLTLPELNSQLAFLHPDKV